MRRALSIAVALSAACAPVPTPPPASRVVDYDAGTTLSLCADAGSRLPGQHCRCERDCAGDTICLKEEVTGDPQGLCAAACFSGSGCDAGFSCSNTVCYQQCQAPEDCPPQSNCVLGQCLPFCIADSECLSGNCNRYIGTCLPTGQTPGGAGLDAVCQNNIECKSNLCLDGHCSSPCSVSKGGCPEDGVCARVKDDLGECFLPCTPPQACATSDRRCASVSPGAPPSCLPTTSTMCAGKQPSPTGGRPCGCDDDCDTGTRCLTEFSGVGFPQGVCQQNCNTTADCTSPDVCLAGVCWVGCSSTDQCDPGRICISGICLPYCLNDSDCLGGQCNRYSGRCKATPEVDGGVGATCASDADCKSGTCDTGGHSDGECLTYCSAAPNSCPDSALCIKFSGVAQSGSCQLPCSSPADCPQANTTCHTSGAGGYCD